MKTVLFILALAIAFISGWIMNIVDLVHSGLEPLTTLVVLRLIGVIIAPLGSFLGWFF